MRGIDKCKRGILTMGEDSLRLTVQAFADLLRYNLNLVISLALVQFSASECS
jgi:TPP-dependent 2-oxoacid decarboxylase